MIPSTRAGIEALPVQEAFKAHVLTTMPVLGDAFKLYLFNDDESLTQAIVNTGYWESWVTAWHVRNISEGDVYVDLGANAGYYSFLAEYLGADVYAFEANERYCTLMDQTSILNGSRVKVINRAISDVEGGTIRLNLYGNMDGSASIVGEGWNGRYIDVKQSKLDYWRLPAGNLIVKMDIEGAEELAWDGMTETLAYRKPTIIMEYTPGAYSETFWDKMRDYGKISLLDYEGNETLVTEKYADLQTDWITLVVRPR